METQDNGKSLDVTLAGVLLDLEILFTSCPPTNLSPDDHGSLSFSVFEHFRTHRV